MALTGHLSDLSLSELIEFFCNQRKTGRLKVLYRQGPGYFHLQTGSVVDAKIGTLRGIDAVYYALTLPNAAFEFNAATESPERTINQPWTQVVLEGLRRLDEGVIPPEAFPDAFLAADVEADSDDVYAAPSTARVSHVPSFLSVVSRESLGQRKPLIAGAVAVAVLASVAAIGFPAGWYGRSKPSVVSSQPTSQPNNPAPSQSPANVANDSQTAKSSSAETDARATEAVALAAKRLKERERAAKAREEKANAAASNDVPKSASPAPQNVGSEVASKSGPRKVVVQVTYDESGRVIAASGSDPTALRIARQKRFPPGKAGTATITIPIN